MRSLLPPRAPRFEARWYAASVAVHVVFLGALVWVSTHAPNPDRKVRLVRLFEDPTDPPRQFTMRLGDLVAGGVELAEADAAGTLGRVSIAPVLIEPWGGGGARTPISAPESLTIGIPGAITTVPGAIVVGTRRRIGPTFGDGSVWQGPPQVFLSEGGGGEWGPLEAQLALRVVEMLDSLLLDSLMQEGIPRWVFTAGGQQWGVDPMFIHLGPVKIPTILLGYLPGLPQGNYEQMQQARWLADVRQQIVRQAQDMDRLESFRGYIDQLRARRLKERERERIRRGLVAGRDSSTSR